MYTGQIRIIACVYLSFLKTYVSFFFFLEKYVTFSVLYIWNLETILVCQKSHDEFYESLLFHCVMGHKIFLLADNV